MFVSNSRKKIDDINDWVRINIEMTSNGMKDQFVLKKEDSTFGELVKLHNPQRRRGFSPKLHSFW